jgi:PhnB protein
MDHPTISISLTVKTAAEAIEFYTRALGAKELYRMAGPDGGLFHCEFMIGNTRLYMSDEDPTWHAKAMDEGTLASCLFSIATEDCDASFQTAVDAGAKPLLEPTNFFWGMRTANVADPFGYRWSFGQFLEEVSPEEMEKRAKIAMETGKMTI